MKPIIFLEIDGVLTTQKGTDEAMKRLGDMFDTNGIEHFCPKSIEILNKITNATGADIVIISNWKNAMTIEKMRELFNNRKITGNIIGYTPISGINPTRDIEMWMKKNGRPKSYVIIDDENEMSSVTEVFPEDRFVGTQFTHGIAHKTCYKRSINYLNRLERIKIEEPIKNLF